MFDRITDRYSNKTVVIVGSGGIGSSIANLLGKQPARLIVVDRDLAALDRISQPVVGSLETQVLDVTDSEAVQRCFESVHQRCGSIDYLFYTAGVLNIESLADTTSQLWDRAVQINLSGAFYCLHAAAAYMRDAGSGSILILGSIAGTKARSGSRVNPVYNATKAAIAALVNGSAMQLRSYGVRVNCISPGPTATSMMDVQPPQVHASVNEIALDGRMNSSIEVAELALFVAAHGRFTGEDVAMGGGAGLGG